MKRAESPETERLSPPDEHPDVKEKWAAVVAARQAVREADAQLTRAQAAVGKHMQEERTHERARPWSAVEFWRSRSELPALEAKFYQAQERLLDAEAAHRDAVSRVRADLARQVRERLLPSVQAVVAAIESVRRGPLGALLTAVPAFDALGVDLNQVAPFGHLAMLDNLVAQSRRNLDGWLAGPPAPPPLPAGHVLVECREFFKVMPNGDIERDEKGAPRNVGHPFGLGATITVGQRCAVTAEAAEVLVEMGRAERVDAAG